MIALKHSASPPWGWEPFASALKLGDALILAALCALVLLLVFTIWAWPMSSGEKRRRSS
jgi:hypothetical protein